MKSAVLSACFAAGVVLMTSGARAEPADCDLFCHLQGYLSTDHMAAPTDGSAAPSAVPTAKPRRHAAGAPAKTGKPGVKTAAKPPSGAAAEAVVKPSVQAVANSRAKSNADAPPPPIAKTDATAATAIAKPSTITHVKTATVAPHPKAPTVAGVVPPKRHAVAAVASPSPPAMTPPAVAAAPSRHIAHALPHLGRKDVSHPVASAALIPGSARLVPAEFQAFGNL